MTSQAEDLEALYKGRFCELEISNKLGLWKVLCKNFFQQFVPSDATLLDVGAGYCDFINNIDCKTKFAIDLNPDTKRLAGPDVTFIQTTSTDLSYFPENFIDRAFTSNFLEHLRSKEEILKTLSEIFRVLKPGGKVLILQPNIRLVGNRYWDFFDHHIPLTEKSLQEALQISGFTLERVISRFLPYTTKSNIPKNPTLIQLYLRLPVIWRFFGKQCFILARKPCPF